ncbi:MAG: TonB-dependent receptor [Prevotella sp.]|nr:TonB-dependent receptor [Prevotella sp.]
MKLNSLLIAALAVATIPAGAATDSLQLKEVVVTGTRQATDARHLPYSITVLNREQLTEGHQLSLLPTLSRQVPGLFATSRSMMGYGVSGGSAGAMSIRGISSASAATGAGQMMVLVDGHPHYQGLFGHSIADSYQTLMAEQVEVLRGPASVLYGSNAMGGVVNIITRKMQQNGIRNSVQLGAGSWGTVQAEATNQIRQGRFSSTIAAQYGRSDNHRPRMGFEQYGGMAKLGYDFSSHWTASADAEITHFNASYPGAESAPIFGARQWITRGITSVAIHNSYKNTNGSLSGYYNFGRHKINDGHQASANPPANYFRSDDAMIGLMWYQNVNLFHGNTTTVGLDYQHIYGKAWNRVIATGENKDPMVNKHENEIAGYINFQQELLSWLTFNAGIRLDHHSQTGNQWIPQGGLAFRPIRHGELKASVSKGFRNPTIREMYLFGTKNDQLQPERLVSYELAWKHRLPNRGTNYGINLFYIDGSNIIASMPRQGGGMQFVNTGKVKNYGAELQLDYPLSKHWSVDFNFSYLHMKYPVLGAPERKSYINIKYRQAKWTASIGGEDVRGLYTAVGNTEKKENFSLLHATLGYDLFKNVNLWARGENLLAKKYEVNAGYPMPRATFMAGVKVEF